MLHRGPSWHWLVPLILLDGQIADPGHKSEPATTGEHRAQKITFLRTGQRRLKCVRWSGPWGGWYKIWFTTSCRLVARSCRQMDNGRHKLSICCCPEDPGDDDHVVIVVSRLAGPQIASFCWSLVSCSDGYKHPCVVHLPSTFSSTGILVVVIIDLNHFRFSHLIIRLLCYCRRSVCGRNKDLGKSTVYRRVGQGILLVEWRRKRRPQESITLIRSGPVSVNSTNPQRRFR